MHPHSLQGYVIGVVIVFAFLIALVWLIRGAAEARTVGTFALGFLAGMLSMYIAVHIYP
jgi:hypothetical protein